MLNFFDYSLSDLQSELTSFGKEKYRAEQIFKWVYQHRVQDFCDMSNLSKQLREELTEKFEFALPQVLQQFDSVDGTRKFLFSFAGKTAECVLIPSDNRMTICLSSEVGCNMACKFCYTGKQKLKRRLSAGEIVGQFVVAHDSLRNEDREITNIVFMGMGEPLDNSDAVFKSIDILSHDFGYNISRKKTTVSTSGIVPEMPKIWQNKVRLAVSLNASNDEIRDYVMPINKRWPLEELLVSCREYTLVTKDRVTLEYVLLKDVTDRIEDADRLKKLLKGLPCKINLIPFNEHPGSDFTRPNDTQVLRFQKRLMKHGFHTIIRKTMGRDIYAACGQLTSHYQGRPERMFGQDFRALPAT